MEILKLTSIRLSSKSLANARILGRAFGLNQASYVLRVAIWVGLKMLKPEVMQKVGHMMWEEEVLGVSHKLEDVLRAAGVSLENLKSSK